MRTYKIGRLSNNDICLPNDQVSRQHADLTCMDDGTYMLTDHSKNGTMVNGRPLNHTSMAIKYGDNVVFGNSAYLDWSKIQPATTYGGGNSGSTEWVNGPVYVDNPPVETGANGMAIAGFVCAFLIPLLGLIFSIIGLNKANDRPDHKGHGLAVAGIIISSIIMFINLICVIVINAL